MPNLHVTDMVENTSREPVEDLSRTIFLVGNKSAGKSTLLHAFLDKNENVRETLVLEYSFARKSSQKQSLEKSICHIWEYGGKIEMLGNILSSIPKNKNVCYCVMVDLSKVKAIWNVLDVSIQALKENYAEIDFPELYIIGGKYDLFKNFDSDLKKCVCTALRSVALIHNATLFYYSSKEHQLLRKAKDILHSLGFGTEIPIKEKHTNYTKPLFLLKGTDSWEHIGVPASTMDEVRGRFISRIGSETKIEREVKPLQRTHPEPVLDSLATLKYEELRNIEAFDPNINEYLAYMH